MVITAHLSTSTSNGKKLTAPTKDMVLEWIRKTKPLHMLPTRGSLHIKRLAPGAVRAGDTGAPARLQLRNVPDD